MAETASLENPILNSPYLRVLFPADDQNYYDLRGLVPVDLTARRPRNQTRALSLRSLASESMASPVCPESRGLSW